MTTWQRGIVGFFVVLGVLALTYLIRVDEPHECNLAYVKAHGAKAVMTTPLGHIHFEDSGANGTQPVVILIHGVSGPMKIWDKIYPQLVATGIRTVRYDLFGRGLSQRVDRDYDEDLYDRQLFDLITGLRLPTPVTLVGSSMGAVIATGFRNRHPDLVNKLVLIGPAGFPIEASPAAAFLQVPVIGEYLMGVVGSSTLKTHHQKYFVRPENYPEMHEAFAEQLRCRGTKHAILSTMRHMPVNNFASGYRKVGDAQTPLLLIWGQEDRTFNYAFNVQARQLMPQSQLVTVSDAAHLPQYEKPEAFEMLPVFIRGGI